jgi:hypothetical protein
VLQNNKKQGEENKIVQIEATSQIAKEDQYFKKYNLFIFSYHIGVSSFPPNFCLFAYKYLTTKQKSHNCQYTKLQVGNGDNVINYYFDVVVGV